jgi:CHAT domain-containing protein
MPKPESARELAKAAASAHRAGAVDREIELRRQAYARSVEEGHPLPEQIESAAQLICDIGERLEDPSSEAEWRLATAHADARWQILDAAVSALVRAEAPERAFAITQRVKSPFLVRRLRQHTLRREDLSLPAQRYRELFLALEKAMRAARQATRLGTPASELRAAIAGEREARFRLQEAAQSLRREDPAALAGFAAPLLPDDLLSLFPPDGGSCLVDLYVTGEECVALLARRTRTGVDLSAMVLTSLNLPLLTSEGDAWTAALRSGNLRQLETAIVRVAQFLHDHLMCSLGKYMRDTGAWQAIVVPHRVMHAMPLHLAPLCETGNQKLFCEQFAVNYSPCVQLALTTALRPRPVEFIKGELAAFLACDPAGDLPGARREQHAVAAALARHPWGAAPVPSRAVAGADATVRTVAAGLSDAGIAVLATHAAFVPGDPFGSGLLLNSGAGKAALWTIDAIYMGGQLRNSPVILLTACESGMSHFDDSAEVVALPPALVSIGAGTVLSSLWPLEDVATSIFAERFVHHLLDPGETPSTALHEAVEDLRRTTRDTALDRCDEILAALEDSGSYIGDSAASYLRLTAMRTRIADGPEQPFSAPLIWGGFFITGCGWRSGGGKVVIERRGADALLEMGMAVEGVKAAAGIFGKREYGEAIRMLRESIPKLDGLWLGRALLLLGDSLYRNHDERFLFDLEGYRRQLEEALQSVTRARDILESQGGEDQAVHYCGELMRSIRNTLQ